VPAPTVRLAVSGDKPGPTETERRAKMLCAPSVRLAVCGPPDALAKGLTPAPDEQLPALLVSYYYLNQFVKNRARYHYRDWVMDSGAFSAHNSGKTIVLADYIAKCKEMAASDPKLTEIFALDVIGDATGVQSLKNCETMWKAGVQAIPTYHVGEPWANLLTMARDYPKIALGGMVGLRSTSKKNFVAECFQRVWPCKMHGFGVGSEDLIMAFPFHSVDATNWEMGPCAFGRWAAYGGNNLSIRGGQHNLRVEVEHYLRMEKRARGRWAREMQKLDEASVGQAPNVRLAWAAGAQARQLKTFASENAGRTRQDVALGDYAKK
jgi:hypothetical protein